MTKSTVEFTLTRCFPTSEKDINLKTQTLSRDSTTGDSTILLTHAPGSEWGGSRCQHEYWEEVYIIEGRIYDKTLDKWFEAGSYCCRPPGMLHGPYKADADAGCREICWLRHEKPKSASSLSRLPGANRRRAVFFDLMGTCLDWHSGVTKALTRYFPAEKACGFAFQWREAFFEDIESRFKAGLPVEDIDDTHRRTLETVLNGPNVHVRYGRTADCPNKESLVQAWHQMPPWPDVLPALSALRSRGYQTFVLANGTTRLQLDLMRSSGLGSVFDMLFSSELLGISKPNPNMYKKAMALVGVQPTDAVMVAAHAYDLRAAGSGDVGIKTVYVRRETEDRKEDMDAVREENAAFIDGMDTLVDAVERALSS